MGHGEIARESARSRSRPLGDRFCQGPEFVPRASHSDWVLMLDADERLDPGARWLLHCCRESIGGGYQVTIRNYVEPNLGHNLGPTGKPQRLFVRPGSRLSGVHRSRKCPPFSPRSRDLFYGPGARDRGLEDPGGSKRELGAADSIHHFGMVRDAEVLARKILFYRELGKRRSADSPETPRHTSNWASRNSKSRQSAGALASLQRSCQLNPHFGVAWFFAWRETFAWGIPCKRRARSSRGTTARATPWNAEMAGDTSYNLGDYTTPPRATAAGPETRPGQSLTLESKLGPAEAPPATPSRRGGSEFGAIENRALRARTLRSADPCRGLVKGLPQRREGAEESSMQWNLGRRFSSRRQYPGAIDDWPQAPRLLREGLAAFPDSEQLQATLFKVETTNESNY